MAAIDGYIGDYNVHVADAVIHVSQADRDKWDAVDNKADASALTAHTGDTTIHVTAADKQTWDTGVTQAYVLRYASVYLTALGTVAFSVLDNTDNVKIGDKVLDSDGKLFALTAVDTQNSTFTIGTALIDLAQDSDVVHKSGDETVGGNKDFSGTTNIQSLTINGVAAGDILTYNASEFVGVTGNQIIGGIKTFSNDIRISKASPFCNIFSNGYIKGQAPSSNIYSGIRFFDDINSGSTNNITGGFEVEYNRDGYNKSYIASRNYAGETHKVFTIGLRVPNDDTRSIDFLPSVNNIVNLGTSTNKWKSFNGLEPSSLGMPDLDNGIDISSYLTAGNSNNTYTPSVNGFVSVSIGVAWNGCAVFLSQGDMKVSNYSNTAKYQDTDMSCFACMPVVGGVTVNIGLKGADNYIRSAKFFPCQGNV